MIDLSLFPLLFFLLKLNWNLSLIISLLFGFFFFLIGSFILMSIWENKVYKIFDDFIAMEKNWSYDINGTFFNSW